MVIYYPMAATERLPLAILVHELFLHEGTQLL